MSVVRLQMMDFCESHPGDVTNRELWDQVGLTMLVFAIGIDELLYPVVRAGKVIAVTYEALKQDEEVEMATYIQGMADAVAEWAGAELERLQTS